MGRIILGKRSISLVAIFLFLGLALIGSSNMALAKSAREIDISVDVALDEFAKDVKGGREFLKSAKGILVFPSVIKAGIGIGGEYGEGALRIGGKTVDYYNTAAASIGFQLGAQSKRVIIVFMENEALKKFRASQGWEAGVDGSVALVEMGTGGSIDTNNIKDPIVGFVFGNKGLMYNLTVEGSKGFTNFIFSFFSGKTSRGPGHSRGLCRARCDQPRSL
jgi:lipid-binding SYLF domain-containing protein